MTTGPQQSQVRRLRLLVVLTAVLVLVVAGVVVGRRVYRVETDTISLAELRAAYAAFLTPDGRNTVTDLQPAPPDTTPLSVRPEACAPLVLTAFDARFPAGAAQGVSTFQGGGYGYSVSLFSYRWDDEAGAERAFATLQRAADSCRSTPIVVGSPFSARLALSLLDTTVPQTDATLDLVLRQSPDQLYQETVVRQKNVLSWEYTYRSGRGATLEHNLLTGLCSRVRSLDKVGT